MTFLWGFVAGAGHPPEFWYYVHCPDLVNYDWATATLTDNTAMTTTTLLPPTCTNGTNWAQVRWPLAAYAGHSVTITLTSHDDNFAGDPTYTWFDDVVVQCLQNGGFETGDLSAWTAVGATGISASPHSGTFAAVVGSTAPTAGDSSVAQSFIVPAGCGSLSFWYNVHCPDSVNYDWATATLTDNTVSTTATILPNTCTNGAGWTQVLYPVVASAGHQVTLTLTNHDDNNAADPTYTEFDDVLGCISTAALP